MRYAWAVSRERGPGAVRREACGDVPNGATPRLMRRQSRPIETEDLDRSDARNSREQQGDSK